jgi:hypothetical protein
MEVLRQESPVVVKQLTVQEQWAQTPPVIATASLKSRKPLQPSMSNCNKRPSAVAPRSAKAYKKARLDEEEAPVKACDIDARIRMLFPNDNVIGKVRPNSMDGMCIACPG